MEKVNSLRGEIRARIEAEFSYRNIMQTCSRLAIEEALIKCNGNQCAAADLLGIHRNTMFMQLKKLGINPRDFHMKPKMFPTVRTYRKNEGIA